jgi:hypothetical protein
MSFDLFWTLLLFTLVVTITAITTHSFQGAYAFSVLLLAATFMVLRFYWCCRWFWPSGMDSWSAARM